VTFDDLSLLSEGDLAKLVPKLGPRRRLWNALHPLSPSSAELTMPALDSPSSFEFSKFHLSSNPSPTQTTVALERSSSPSQHVCRPHTAVTYSTQRSNAARLMQERLLAVQQHKHVQLQQQHQLQVQQELARRRLQHQQSIQAQYIASSPSASTSSSPVPFSDSPPPQLQPADRVVTSSTSVVSPGSVSVPPANLTHLTVYTGSPTAHPSSLSNLSPTTMEELRREAARQAMVRPFSASDAFGTLHIVSVGRSVGRFACVYL
jgi:hypothetical protein